MSGPRKTTTHKEWLAGISGETLFRWFVEGARLGQRDHRRTHLRLVEVGVDECPECRRFDEVLARIAEVRK